jgi:two-component system response regulator LytT
LPYDECALRAFKLNSIDYILKPIDEDDLEVTVQKFQPRMQNNECLKMNFDEIRKMLSNPFEKNHKRRFTVRIGQHLKVILVEEIECVDSENKGTYIHTFDNRNYLIESSLELLEQDLNPKQFYRISRKSIIPLQAIKEIVFYSNSRLKVVLLSYISDDVIVSREKVSDFKNWIG